MKKVPQKGPSGGSIGVKEKKISKGYYYVGAYPEFINFILIVLFFYIYLGFNITL